MGTVYARGKSLWIGWHDQAGKRICQASGYRVGQESRAKQLLEEIERGMAPGTLAALTIAATRAKAEPNEPGPEPPALGITLQEYGDKWLAARWDRVASVRTEKGELVNHVYPRIGSMPIRDVRPRHIRDFVLELSKANIRQRGTGTGEGDSTIAPRTVRHICSLLHRLFKSAVIDEVIVQNPVVVEKGVLPKNVDKDPAWRASAVFGRAEVVGLITDARIPMVRRMVNAIKALGGVRHGEAAGLRWSDYQTEHEPLGKLVVSRSYENERTKTQVSREIPVHPALAQMLSAWRASGWSATFGREPVATDLVVPGRYGDVFTADVADDLFKADLLMLGLRHRRGHDLRRTFITLAQVDGARRDLLKVVTHGPAANDIVSLYTSFPWASLCAEVAKLNIDLRAPAPTPKPRPVLRLVEDTDEIAAPASDAMGVAATAATLATVAATAKAEIRNNLEPVPGYDPGTYGLRNRCSTTELHRRGAFS